MEKQRVVNIQPKKVGAKLNIKFGKKKINEVVDKTVKELLNDKHKVKE